MPFCLTFVSWLLLLLHQAIWGGRSMEREKHQTTAYRPPLPAGGANKPKSVNSALFALKAASIAAVTAA